MNLGLEGRVCVVTGASVGTGCAFLACLAARGARVIAVGLRDPLLDQLASVFASNSWANPLCLSPDAAARNALATFRAAALGTFDRVDLLVNNAGQSGSTDARSPEEVWGKAMQLNFNARRRIARAVLPPLSNLQYGRIANITGSSEPATINAAITANGAVYS